MVSYHERFTCDAKTLSLFHVLITGGGLDDVANDTAFRLCPKYKRGVLREYVRAAAELGAEKKSAGDGERGDARDGDDSDAVEDAMDNALDAMLEAQMAGRIDEFEDDFDAIAAKEAAGRRKKRRRWTATDGRATFVGITIGLGLHVLPDLAPRRGGSASGSSGSSPWIIKTTTSPSSSTSCTRSFKNSTHPSSSRTCPPSPNVNASLVRRFTRSIAWSRICRTVGGVSRNGINGITNRSSTSPSVRTVTRNAPPAAAMASAHRDASEARRGV